MVSYLWYDADDPHNADYLYGVGDVQLWRDMVARHVTVPHEFVCITDDQELFSGTGIRAVPFDKKCVIPGAMFQQLMPFHPSAGTLIGERILTMD